MASTNTDDASDYTWKKLENTSHTLGYQEGLDIGKENKLQQGFDEGYALGFISDNDQQAPEMKGFLSSFILKKPFCDYLKNVIENINSPH